MLFFTKNYFSYILYFGTIIYALFCTTRFFGTNDDMLVMLFLSGLYTGEPSEYIVFQNIIIGKVLKQLYIYDPSINWYTLFFDIVQTLSFGALFILMNKILDKKIFIFLFVFPMLYFIVEMYTYLQFTKVAFLSSITGILYIILFLYNNKKRYMVLAFILLTLGFMIRFKALYGSVLLFLPVAGHIFFKHRKYILNLKFLIFSFVIISTFFSLHIYNHNYYNNTPEWKNFKALIDIRRIVYYDRSITKECFLKYSKLYNISKNDVKTFYKWANDDAKVFTPALLHHIHSSCTTGFELQYEKATNINSLKQFFYKLSTFDFSFIFIFIIYLLFILSKQAKLFFILYFFYFTSILFFIFTLIFDYRVVSSLVLEFYLLLLLFTHLEKVKKYYFSTKMLTYVTFSLFFLSIYTILYPKVMHKKIPISLKNELPILKDNYIIVLKSNNFFNYLPLDTNFKNLFENKIFYYVGWTLSSPDNLKVLKNAKNFYELLLNKPNVILYMDEHRLPVIKQYIYEHFGKNIEFIQLMPYFYKVKIH